MKTKATEPETFVSELNKHLSYLYAFARQMNELDFAASLSGEFRGAQDAGWSTTITAHEVYRELSEIFQSGRKLSKAEIRVALMLYCQLAEAGGIYESLKNIIGVVTLKPYLLWPFQDLVRVKTEPKRIIGPNANATFRDLATHAKRIGMSRLSFLLEDTFRDDVRNGIYHADYIIWDDGLRLRKRNGGNAMKLSFAELTDILGRGVNFFQLLEAYTEVSARSFNPPRTTVGRLSANPPMPWTVAFDPTNGSFRISGSSPGPVTTPAYERQTNINGRLGGNVLAAYSAGEDGVREIENTINEHGFEPASVVMNPQKLSELVNDVEKLGLWDDRHKEPGRGPLLLATPWGFRWLKAVSDFANALPEPIVTVDVESRTAAPPPGETAQQV